MQVLRRCVSESETTVPRHQNKRKRTQSEPLKETEVTNGFKADGAEIPITNELLYLVIILLSCLNMEELKQMICDILLKKQEKVEDSESHSRDSNAQNCNGPKDTIFRICKMFLSGKLQCVGCETRNKNDIDFFLNQNLENVLKNTTESALLKQSFSTFYKTFLRCFGSLQPTYVKTFPLIECSRNLEDYVKKELSANQSRSTELTQAHNLHSMNMEIIRLGTFSTFPQQSSVSTLKLAKEGFYYTGEDDKVACYACGIQHSGWRQADDPRDIHRQMSPNCSFVNSSQSENIPIRGAEDIANLAPASQPLEQNVSENSTQRNGRPEEMALQNSTLLNSNNSRNRNNSACLTHTVNTSSCSNQFNENQINNSERQVAGGSPKSSREIQEKINAFLGSLDPLGINFDRPKYPSYAVVATRVSSFKDWPSCMTQKPRDLALAGFLYAGYGDYTRCFFCGGGLRNWEPEDDPWIEHARWFPKCAFLRQNKGDEFVALVQIEHEEQEKLEEMETTGNAPSFQSNNPTIASSLSNSGHTNVSNIYDLASVQSVLDMGYSQQVVKEAFDVLNFSKHKDDITGEDLMNIILSNEESSTGLDTSPLTQNTKPDTRETSESVPSVSQNVIESGSPKPGSNLGSSENVSEVYKRLLNSKSDQEEHSFSDTKSLIEENRKLKDLRLCKICLENDASIAMLPCGHLCCCPDCAPAMRKCPICRQFVKGTVRTWLV
ncbi:baculoviral IAP repeat-containing protein 2-like [Saccostrea echinata]|uniref:baculoviral IAP repeat-containing protein 2-like n=1 Tax=Saccostrea echinata TaxID=191078 RepID=UPI002A81DD15|nr:baculoviral IAP repeat-containing protein 2-like [Saccostrea echinata]